MLADVSHFNIWNADYLPLGIWQMNKYTSTVASPKPLA